MFGGNGLSLSDIAAVTRGNNNGNDGGWNNAWWIIIILMALWENNGFGNNRGNRDNGSNGGGSNNYYYTDAAMQRGFDNQAVISKLDGLSNGICSLGYDQLGQFNSTNTNILGQANALMAQLQQCCCNIENMITQAQFANQTATTALGNQLQQCCCDIRQGQSQAEYNRATDTCNIIAAVQQASQANMNNCNANYRALHDELIAFQRQQDQQTIAELRAQLERCDDRNLISAQTAELKSYLRPPANPAFVVPAPWYASYGGYNCYPQQGCCQNQGFNFGF